MLKMLKESKHLPESVATVDDVVGAGHVGRGVRSEVHGQTVEVVDGTETLLWGVVDPDDLLGIESGDAVEGGVHVTGGNAVDADAVASPLSGERLGHHDHTGLGRVVSVLLLWVVDHAAGHGRDIDDGTSVAELDQLLAEGLVDHERADEVDIHSLAPLLRVVLLCLDVGPETRQY